MVHSQELNNIVTSCHVCDWTIFDSLVCNWFTMDVPLLTNVFDTFNHLNCKFGDRVQNGLWIKGVQLNKRQVIEIC